MNRKLLLPFALSALLLPATLRAGTAKDSSPSPRYTVFYFHTTSRCSTCIRIEQLARDVVEKEFADLVPSGDLRFQSVDVQYPENRHFIRRFRLVTKSVVLVEGNPAQPVRWKNLDKVWQLVWYEDRYRSYIRQELKAFLEGK
ncbi:MAG: hypothetical protein Kow00109_24710 [Acidobacteriota bacterium]